MEELAIAVRKYRINMIMFYDECISSNLPRLFELCEGIKKLREELSWELLWTPQLTVQNITGDVLKRIKDSGGVAITYGFESFSSTVLASMKKPITPQMIENAFIETINAGTGVRGNFIFGDSAETLETAKLTLDWWRKNARYQINLLFIQPLPGSEMYHRCFKKGIIQDEASYIEKGLSKNHYYNMTDTMNDRELKKMITEVLTASVRCRIYARHHLQKTGSNVFRVIADCPNCGTKTTYENCFIEKPLFYSFELRCRTCRFRFFIMHPIKKMFFALYPFLYFIKR
jgi:anaerobic magnesium-protoporphyrin IX monomethyl ester cyclase